MRIMTQTVGLVVLSLFGSAAGLWADDSIPVLVAKSDAVVVGTVVTGTWSSTGAVFSLRVERTIKGTVYEGQALAVSWKSPSSRVHGDFSISGEHGLFFLAEEGAEWRLVPVFLGHVPFVGAYYTLSKASAALALSDSWIGGDTVIEKIATELSASVEQCEKNSHDHRGGEALVGLENTALQQRVMDKLWSSACVNSRALATALSLKMGIRGALTQLVARIEDGSKTPYINMIGSRVLANRSERTEDVAALGSLATTSADIGRVKTDARGSVKSFV